MHGFFLRQHSRFHFGRAFILRARTCLPRPCALLYDASVERVDRAGSGGRFTRCHVGRRRDDKVVVWSLCSFTCVSTTCIHTTRRVLSPLIIIIDHFLIFFTPRHRTRNRVHNKENTNLQACSRHHTRRGRRRGRRSLMSAGVRCNSARALAPAFGERHHPLGPRRRCGDRSQLFSCGDLHQMLCSSRQTCRMT